jgi:hypothetical protein
MALPGGAYLEGHLDRSQLATSRWRVDQSFIEGMSGPDYDRRDWCERQGRGR